MTKKITDEELSQYIENLNKKGFTPPASSVTISPLKNLQSVFQELLSLRKAVKEYQKLFAEDTYPLPDSERDYWVMTTESLRELATNMALCLRDDIMAAEPEDRRKQLLTLAEKEFGLFGEEMSNKIKFEVGVGTGFINCSRTREIEVDEEELEGMSIEESEEYVWEECGGREMVEEMTETWCRRQE